MCCELEDHPVFQSIHSAKFPFLFSSVLQIILVLIGKCGIKLSQFRPQKAVLHECEWHEAKTIAFAWHTKHSKWEMVLYCDWLVALCTIHFRPSFSPARVRFTVALQRTKRELKLLYCIVLCCIILYCTRYCTGLYCDVLYFIVLYCIRNSFVFVFYCHFTV